IVEPPYTLKDGMAIEGETMGLFISRTVNPRPVEEAIELALRETPPSTDAAKAKARNMAPGVAQSTATGTTEYHTGRIVFAIFLFFVLLGLAIAADHFEWVKETGKLWGFVEAVFGVIVGYLGGEASGATATK